MMLHLMFSLLHQCQRSKTQQKADKNSMFHALDLNSWFTTLCFCHHVLLISKMSY